MPKGTDLAVFSQAELDDIAWQMNARTRKNLDWTCPANCSCPNRSMFVSIIMKSLPWEMSFGRNRASVALQPSNRLFSMLAIQRVTTPPAILPCCDHYVGSEKLTRQSLTRQSLALQVELGPVFDVTLDCEDGTAVGRADVRIAPRTPAYITLPKCHQRSRCR
ncbi:MAG: hypothetical protein VB142_01570 [Burkholderia sp.]